MKKHFLAIILLLSIFCLMSRPAYAINDVIVLDEDEVFASLVKDIGEVFGYSNEVLATAELISVVPSKAESRSSIDQTKEKVIQFTLCDNTEGYINSVTVTPFVIDGETDRLVNLFSSTIYTSPGSSPGSQSVTADCYLSANCRWTKYYTFDRVVYRPYEVQVSWSSTNTGISAELMSAMYETKGQLYNYPECLTNASMEDALLQDPYTWTISINQFYPTIDQPYIEENALPTNRAIRCPTIMDGMYVGLQFNYKLNGGTTKSWEWGYDVKQITE